MASETDPTKGLSCYLVGGAVRDRLLGLEVKERDFVVVGAQVETMLARGFILVGKDFPVFLHPHTHEEYALARTERKVAPGYRGFSVHAADDVTLEQDLQRRDLTINALAEATDGRLIDPTADSGTWRPAGCVISPPPSGKIRCGCCGSPGSPPGLPISVSVSPPRHWS